MRGRAGGRAGAPTLLACAALAALLVVSPAPSGGTPTATAAKKKCKKKHGRKHRCKKKQQATPAVPVPYGAKFTIAPTSHDFGSVAMAATSPGFTFSVANSGTFSSNFPGIKFGGANAASFAVKPGTNTCTHALLAGESCSFTVTFHPGATGARSGTVTVFTAVEIYGGTATATLSGTGI